MYVEKSTCKISLKTALELPPYQPLLGFSTTFLANVNNQKQPKQLIVLQQVTPFFNKIIVTTLFLCC